LRGWSRNVDSIFSKEKKRLSEILKDLDKFVEDLG
jgi:hypothetical protein